MRDATRRRTDERGQAHTLEALVASLLLVNSLIFAIQITAVTPLTESTASQHIENQQRATADGVLAMADETGALKRAVLYWNVSADEFRDADNGRYYTNAPPTNEFGDLLNRSFNRRGFAYNVYVVYQTDEANHKRQRMVYRGNPSDNAVSASRAVSLYDDDEVHADADDDGTAEPTGTTISTSTFYAPDVMTTSGVYTVVRVEVIVWRQ